MVKRAVGPNFVMILLALTMGYFLSVSSSLILIDRLEVAASNFVGRSISLSIEMETIFNICTAVILQWRGKDIS